MYNYVSSLTCIHAFLRMIIGMDGVERLVNKV